MLFRVRGRVYVMLAKEAVAVSYLRHAHLFTLTICRGTTIIPRARHTLLSLHDLLVAAKFYWVRGDPGMFSRTVKRKLRLVCFTVHRWHKTAETVR
jgi:hypothetical protein